MLPRHNIENYRHAIRENVGKEISLYVKRGRKTIVINNCVIENAYEGIFVVKIIGENLLRQSRISVCYADLLTGNAKVVVMKKEKLA